MHGGTSSVSHYQQTPPLSAIYSTVKMLTTRDGSAVVIAKPDIDRKSQFLPPLGGLHQNTAITFGTEKLWY